MQNACLKVIVFITICPLLLQGCQNSSEQSTMNQEAETQQEVNKPVEIPVMCQQPSPVMDIWKLEPMLIGKGEITNAMNKTEKEQVIKAYIARKNAQYKICVKKGKK